MVIQSDWHVGVRSSILDFKVFREHGSSENQTGHMLDKLFRSESALRSSTRFDRFFRWNRRAHAH